MAEWIDELSRRRLRNKLAGVLHDDKYGWNAPHAGIMEPIHREWADHTANIVLLTIDHHFAERQQHADC